MKEAILMDWERSMQTLLPTVRYYENSKLLGDTSVIKSDIIEPHKESLPKDPFPHLDLDYLEVDDSQLFEMNIRKPQKPDGDLLIFKNVTLFTEMTIVDEQISTLSQILIIRGQYGSGCYGEIVVSSLSKTQQIKIRHVQNLVSHFFLTKVLCGNVGLNKPPFLLI